MYRRLELIVIAVFLAISVSVFVQGNRLARSAALAEFDHITEDSVRRFQTRMNTYLQSLNAAAGFFSVSDSVDHGTLESYVAALDIEDFLPGINGIGFITPIDAGSEGALIEDMRARGFSDFEIKPATDGPELFVITYIAPLAPNLAALGLNIRFEEGRREAAERSRETGLPQLTPRILLVQDETSQPGFLLLRPVYSTAGPANSMPSLTGWVYAPFIGANLLNDLSPSQNRDYTLSVYDGLDADPDTLIYQSQSSDAQSGEYSHTYQVDLYGRTWSLRHNSTLTFDAAYTSKTPLLLMLAGVLITGLFTALLRTIRVSGERNSEIADLRGRKISASEEENRSVIENAVMAILILDKDKKVLFANQAALTCFERAENQLVGLERSEFITDVPRSPEGTSYNATGRTLSGKKLYLDIQENIWTTFDGSPRCTAIVRDVTAESEALSEVLNTKKRIDVALEGAKIGTFEVDLSTGQSVVSKTWFDIMEIPEKDRHLDTQSLFLRRVHPADLPALRKADALSIEGKTERSVAIYRMKSPQGGWRWMRSDAVVIERSVDGAALRLVGTQADITELRNSQDALENSERRFKMLFADAPVGMALMDARGTFKGVNESMCELCGQSEEELVGKVRLADLLSKEDIKIIYAEVSQATELGENTTYRAEHKINHKSREECWGLFNITWSYDKGADAFIYIVQINDITENKQLELVKNEFISTVSHELRTPLTAIKGALGLVAHAAAKELSAANIGLLNMAQTSTDRLTQIVNDILELEKISSGGVFFDIDEHNLGEIVESAAHEMAPFATSTGNTIVTSVPDAALMVHIDEGRTRQIIANLLSNACKYGARDAKILIKAEQIDKVATVFVQNFGPGIPEDFRSRIFKSFSQADGSDTRAKGGTGLGLNITQKLVERQGGHIGYESSPDGPTVFWFTCPLISDHPETSNDLSTVKKSAVDFLEECQKIA